MQVPQKIRKVYKRQISIDIAQYRNNVPHYIDGVVSFGPWLNPEAELIRPATAGDDQNLVEVPAEELQTMQRRPFGKYQELAVQVDLELFLQ